MFEGIPTYPTPSRFWQIIEKHKVLLDFNRKLFKHEIKECDAVMKNVFQSFKVVRKVGDVIKLANSVMTVQNQRRKLMKEASEMSKPKSTGEELQSVDALGRPISSLK